MDKIEKMVRDRMKKAELEEDKTELKLKFFPELYREDVYLFKSKFEKLGCLVEDEVDWDGCVFLNVYPKEVRYRKVGDLKLKFESRAKKSYMYSFDHRGFLKSIYSDWEFDEKERLEDTKKIRKQLDKIQVESSKLEELIESY